MKIKNRCKIKALVLVLILIMLIILGLFFRNYIYDVDRHILNVIKDLSSEKLTIVIKSITSIASAIVLVIISLISLIIIKNKRLGLLISINLIMSTIFNHTLKAIFNRERPLEFMLIDEKGFSFPSGHSMVAMAFYGFLIYLCFLYINKNTIKRLTIIILSILILLIGFSRLYLGVHYPSDVIAGFYLGYVYLEIFILCINKGDYLTKR